MYSITLGTYKIQVTTYRVVSLVVGVGVVVAETILTHLTETLTRRISRRLAALWSGLFERRGDQIHEALTCRRALLCEGSEERPFMGCKSRRICLREAGVGLGNITPLLD